MSAYIGILSGGKGSAWKSWHLAGVLVDWQDLVMYT